MHESLGSTMRERAGLDQGLPLAWWAPGRGDASRLDLFALMAAGSFDARTAALCWIVLERHGSIIVAAEAGKVGKSTTLTALLDFVPGRIAPIVLGGAEESFAFLAAGYRPAESLILINELSDHTPAYTWGERAIRALSLLRSGWALGATLHADTTEETLGLLVDELGADPGDVARIDLVVVLRPMPKSGATVRRVVEVSTLALDGGRVRATTLAGFDVRRDRQVHDAAAEEKLVDRAELAQRTAFLVALAAAGAGDVRAALARYHRPGGSSA